MAAAAEAANGRNPTATTSCGETFVVRNRIMNGTMLAECTSRQFNIVTAFDERILIIV